jgi:hypothetical protein
LLGLHWGRWRNVNTRKIQIQVSPDIQYSLQNKSHTVAIAFALIIMNNAIPVRANIIPKLLNGFNPVNAKRLLHRKYIQILLHLEICAIQECVYDFHPHANVDQSPHHVMKAQQSLVQLI